MLTIEKYEHRVASHCESGTVRNLLKFAGMEISESLIFGLGSGVVFAYLTNAKGISGFPITAIRLPMGKIIDNIEKLCGINFFKKKYKNTDQGLKELNRLVDSGQPVTVCVDMFYMKYLPPFMQIHAPFHFIVIIGREGDMYAVSDPYSPRIGELSVEHLRLAWQPHARFSNDNYLAYIQNIPDSIDWRNAIIKSLKRACKNMVLPPIIRNIAPIFGVDGIKFFAKEIPKWPKKCKALALKEGILFTPTILEEQGTGGGAFRMLYSAFLDEASQILESDDIKKTAVEMAKIGEKWRDASRFLIKIGKTIPIGNDEYTDWYKKNKDDLEGSLKEASEKFIEIAECEKKLFIDLKKAII